MRQSQAISLNALCVLFTVKKVKRLFKQPGQSLCYQLSSGICFESVCDLVPPSCSAHFASIFSYRRLSGYQSIVLNLQHARPTLWIRDT